MNALAPATSSTSISPWLDSHRYNWFRYQVQLAVDNSDIPGFQPFPAYVWIHKNGAASQLYKALAKFAPLFPVVGYEGCVCSWISPPPSGFGNVICLVIGKDGAGRVRLVGGNTLTTPRHQNSTQSSATEFFARYDSSTPEKRNELVLDTINSSMNGVDRVVASRIELDCEAFHAMPVYITVLDGNESQFSVGPAAVEGDRPADFSFESFGEISK
jgi:hypothetical protein